MIAEKGKEMRLIDANSLIGEMHNVILKDGDDRSIFYEVIERQPTIDPVKHGKWLPHPTDADWDICSVCGTGTQKIFHCNDAVYGVYDVDIGFAYCPRCGARMDSE